MTELDTSESRRKNDLLGKMQRPTPFLGVMTKTKNLSAPCCPEIQFNWSDIGTGTRSFAALTDWLELFQTKELTRAKLVFEKK